MSTYIGAQCKEQHQLSCPYTDKPDSVSKVNQLVNKVIPQIMEWTHHQTLATLQVMAPK